MARDLDASKMGSRDRKRGDKPSTSSGEKVSKVVKFAENQDPKRVLTLPTILTIGRVAAVPVFVATFHMNGAKTVTTSIFVLAAFTDWLDGFLARKMRLSTAFGAFLDPVADKLMVAAALVLLCTEPLNVTVFGHVSWLLTAPSVAIICREIIISAVREWAASQDSKAVLQAVAVSNLGKYKTATQMLALIFLLANRDHRLMQRDFAAVSGISLLYISVALAFWSLILYIKKVWSMLFQ